MTGILKSQMIDALLKSIKGIAYILVATTYTSYIPGAYIWRWGDLIISVFKPCQEASGSESVLCPSATHSIFIPVTWSLRPVAICMIFIGNNKFIISQTTRPKCYHSNINCTVHTVPEFNQQLFAWCKEDQNMPPVEDASPCIVFLTDLYIVM